MRIFLKKIGPCENELIEEAGFEEISFGKWRLNKDLGRGVKEIDLGTVNFSVDRHPFFLFFCFLILNVNGVQTGNLSIFIFIFVTRIGLLEYMIS